MNIEFSNFILYFYLPIVIWLVLIIILFGFLLIKYTFGKWTVENPNPYIKETLALPRGIFRAVLTLSLLYGTIVFEITSFALNKPSEGHMSEFMVAFQMMIAFYFGSKVMHQVASNDRKRVVEQSHQAIEVARVGNVIQSPNGRQVSGAEEEETENNFYDPESAG